MKGYQLTIAAMLVALAVGPAGFTAVGLVYPDVPSRPPPWPDGTPHVEYVIGGLFLIHLAASVFTALGVPVFLFRKFGPSGLAATAVITAATWVLLAVSLWLMFLTFLGLEMQKTGKYL